MRNRISICLLAGSVLYLTCLLGSAVSLAVMSIDLGSEWMKIGIVTPGVPMEVVLNKESKRKTPIAISFRNNEREFGENAVTLGTRFPEKAYRNLLDLIGKQIDNPAVNKFQQRFPYYNITGDKDRNTVVFQHDENMQFTVEELLGIVLEKARDLAQDFAGQRVSDAVITVPAFFNQAERRAVKQAADLAGIKVLQLMSNNAAVALNYGIFRRKDFNSTIQRIMFFDMGSGTTEVTIIGYNLVKIKEKGYVEENPQLSILGFGYDRTLGGLELTLRLQKHFAEKFNERKLTTSDVFKNPRAMAKLLKEAERVKIVLSANSDHIAQVESLLDDKDFKLAISRAELEKLGEDLFVKIGPIITSSLKAAELTMDDIDQVILVGAATRVPRVQEEIMKTTKRSELGKSLNTDEAAAMGAVYQAAYLSIGFKVKRFLIKEAVLFPLQVSFERELDPKEGDGIKHVTRTLFGILNPFPQKKVITFNRHVKDFNITVTYGDLGFLSPEENEYFGSQTIVNISITGVATAIGKHDEEHSEYKGTKAHFKLDDSGILILDQVECVFEKTVPDITEPEDPESTLSRLGSTISKLFSGMGQGGDKIENQDHSDKMRDPPADSQSAEPTTNESESAENASFSKNNSAELKQGKVQNDTSDSEKLKTILVKEPLSAKEHILDLNDLSLDLLKASRDKLKMLNDVERAKQELEEAHNSLESFILETRDKVYQPEYISVTTEGERQEINEKLTAISNWLYEESDGAQAKDYKLKLSSLKAITREMFERFKEHRDRPEAFAALNEILNGSTFFLAHTQSLTEEEQYFTEVELKSLQNLIEDTKKWKEEKEMEQAAAPLAQTPIVSVRAIAEKIAALDREVKYMFNKARTSKPKAKAKSDDQNVNATIESTTEDQLNETTIEGNRSSDNKAGTSDEAQLPSQENVIGQSDVKNPPETVTAEVKDEVENSSTTATKEPEGLKNENDTDNTSDSPRVSEEDKREEL